MDCVAYRVAVGYGVSTMNPKTPQASSTRAQLVALLRADPSISATRRARILAAFDAPEGDAGRPVGFIPASLAAKEIGVSLPTVLRWCESGAVASRRLGDRVTLVDREEIAAYASTRPRRKSD